MWSGAKGSRAAHEHLPRQARRASECVHLLMRQMHALAGASGLYCLSLSHRLATSAQPAADRP